MLTTLFAACLMMQQQPRPQAQPRQQQRPQVQQAQQRQQQSDTIVIQGRGFQIPHVPATAKQASKEYKAVLKKINSTIDTLEEDLAVLYKKYTLDELFREMVISKETAALPEAVFFMSVIRDETLGSYFSEIIRMWNEWQMATVQAGAGKLAPSKDPQQNADPQPNRFPGVQYEKQKFTVENVPVDAIPALRETLALWDIKLEAMKMGGSNMRTVFYHMDLPVVSSLQSVMGLSKSDAKKMRNQRALATLAMFSAAKTSASGGFEVAPEEDEGVAEMEELEVEIAGTSAIREGDLEMKKLKFQSTQNWANTQIAKVVSGLYAPEFAKAWESLNEYLDRRIIKFAEMEGSPLIYQNEQIKRLYDLASIRFMEQLRLSLWLCQNVWHRMADKMTETPKPLSRLAPYTVQAENAENPGSNIVLTEMDKKDLIKLASAISKKNPRLYLVRLAQPIYVPNSEDELPQPENTTVKIHIAINGSVSGAEYVSGPEYLRSISLQAAKLLKFYPLKESGFSAPQSTVITFGFDR